MMCNVVFLRISVFFLLHLPPTSLTNAAWLMATKELFPLSYNVLVEKTKNTKKLFFSLKNHLWGCRTNKYILYNFVESALQDPLTLLSYIYGKKPLRKPILYTLRRHHILTYMCNVHCVWARFFPLLYPKVSCSKIEKYT